MLSKNLAGKFITFEGIEGVGKSTIINYVSEYLNKFNVDFTLTREPGGTKLGEEIRNIILSHRDEDEISGETELLLIFAARNHHLENVILPNLKKGRCVLCDRFTDSTYAYQGGGRQVNIKKISIVEKLVQENFSPDLVFILDAPYKIGIKRANNRGKLDRIEQLQESFFNKVRNIFLKRAAEYPEKYVIVDTTKPLSVVKDEVINQLNLKFK